MEIAPAGVSLSFEITYDSPSLHVGMSVYDDSGANPVLVSGPAPMALVVGNTYRAKFLGAAGISYVVVKRVYTDSGLTIVDQNYSAGSESIYCEAPSSGGGGSTGDSVVGYVDNNNVIVGHVLC